MKSLADRLGLRVDPTIFFVSAGLSLIFVFLLVAGPEPIGSVFAAGRKWIVTNLGWFFILGVNVWLGFLIYAAMSRHGHMAAAIATGCPSRHLVPKDQSTTLPMQAWESAEG